MFCYWFRPTNTPDPTLTNSPCNRAVDYFDLFFKTDLIKSITEFTNANTKRHYENENSQNNFETTKRELKTYLGVWVLIEVIYKDRLWRSNPKWPLLQAAGLNKVFQPDRFSQLSCYLHFCDEEQALPQTDAHYDRLYKIRFLLKHLQQKFQEQYISEQQVSIDECMVSI